MKKPPTDPNQHAQFLLDQITSPPVTPPEDERKAAARILGRMGGLKGGPARHAALTKRQESEIGKKAAAARWKGHKKAKPAKKGAKRAKA